VGQPGSDQIHDFNPGIAPSGLFWTTFPFPAANVQFNFGLGTASMQATNWAINDYSNIVNSLGDQVPPIPPIPATVSFTVTWTASGPPTKLPNSSNPTTGFAGTFRDSSAQVSWSASEPAANFQYVSDPASTSTTISGVIGQERNGKFYPPGG
jgi:hypothetical protein